MKDNMDYFVDQRELGKPRHSLRRLAYALADGAIAVALVGAVLLLCWGAA